MKGFRKYLAPFTPDLSGACAVLYALGGILVICDAGGCTGNVCGFDEPRWFTQKSAIFSAGLRDMDAILGRDDLLMQKVELAAGQMDASLIAIIGTPVPAVIATDYHALRRMEEARTGLPVFTIDTTGMSLYDAGQEKAFFQLMERFAAPMPRQPGRVGVLGLTPLDAPALDSDERMVEALRDAGAKDVLVYGMQGGVEAISRAASVEWNQVVSPSGLKAARYLREKFGTPYRIGWPLPNLGRFAERHPGKRVLIVHQQVFADSLRTALTALGAYEAVDAASWFGMDEELQKPGDRHLPEEDDFLLAVQEGGYDVVVADPLLRKALPGFAGDFVPLPHFAVSGGLHRVAHETELWDALLGGPGNG